MDAATCDFHASIEGLLNCVQSTEDGYLGSIAGCICTSCTIIGQQRGMYVDDAPGELLEEGGAQDTHPAGQYDEVNLKEVQQGCETGFAFCNSHEGRNKLGPYIMPPRWGRNKLGLYITPPG